MMMMMKTIYAGIGLFSGMMVMINVGDDDNDRWRWPKMMMVDGGLKLVLWWWMAIFGRK